MNEVNQIPVMLSIEKASELTGITKYRLREMCKSKKIVCILCGNKYLINLNKLIDFLNRGVSVRRFGPFSVRLNGPFYVREKRPIHQ